MGFRIPRTRLPHHDNRGGHTVQRRASELVAVAPCVGAHYEIQDAIDAVVNSSFWPVSIIMESLAPVHMQAATDTAADRRRHRQLRRNAGHFRHGLGASLEQHRRHSLQG